MFLKPCHEIKTTTLQEAHDYYPECFKTLIKNILNNKNYWPWATEEMRNRLRQDPLVQKLGIIEKLTQQEAETRSPRPR